MMFARLRMETIANNIPCGPWTSKLCEVTEVTPKPSGPAPNFPSKAHTRKTTAYGGFQPWFDSFDYSSPRPHARTLTPSDVYVRRQ